MPNARRGEGESGARLAPKTGQKKGRPEGRKGVTGFFCRASLRFQNGTPVSLWLPAGTDGRLMAALISCPTVCHSERGLQPEWRDLGFAFSSEQPAASSQLIEGRDGQHP